MTLDKHYQVKAQAHLRVNTSHTKDQDQLTDRISEFLVLHLGDQQTSTGKVRLIKSSIELVTFTRLHEKAAMVLLIERDIMNSSLVKRCHFVCF